MYRNLNQAQHCYKDTFTINSPYKSSYEDFDYLTNGNSSREPTFLQNISIYL